MKNTSERRPLFERLKVGLEEGIRWTRGELGLRTTEVPGHPPNYTTGANPRMYVAT
jgi:hypothetical protein